MTGEDVSDDRLRHITGWAFATGQPKRLAVAVSGGGDSMACLDLMLWHASQQGFEIEAVTVDHGLRAEAKHEAALVAGYCAKRQVPHSVLNWTWDGTGNLQAAARAARYRLIGAWARTRRIDMVALGHTQNDVAETFLMRLARASGVDGLSEMERRFERDGVTWIRPMLSHGREIWRSYLKRHAISWAEDPSNDDDQFDRVKARESLKALAPLGIDTETLATVAHNLALARFALEHYVSQEARDHVIEDRGDLVLPAEFPDREQAIPPEILFRLRRAALQWIGGNPYPARGEAMIEAEMALKEGKTQALAGCLLSPVEGARLWQRRWRFTREYNAVKALRGPTDAIWDSRWQLSGPHAPDLEVRALGEAVKDTPWRETGLPRTSLMASPAIWRGSTLVAAPLAGFGGGWTAEGSGRGTFTQFLLSR